MKLKLSPKGSIGILLLAITICLPMIAFFVGNWLKIPDEAEYWNVVTWVLAIGLLIAPILALQALVGLLKRCFRREKEKDQVTPPKKSKGLTRAFRLVILFWGFVIVFKLIQATHLLGYSDDERGFKAALADQYALVASGTDKDMEKIRNGFLIPESREIARKSYEETNAQLDNLHQRVIIHSTRVDGDTGFVDRTVSTCRDKDCHDIVNKSRAFKKYRYENRRWLMAPAEIYCPRSTSYKLAPEFERAIKLINARTFTSDNDNETERWFNEIVRCVDVTYASDDSQMNSTEGYIRFAPGQSTEHLNVYVSPRYKEAGDILNAVVLAHELTHAVQYVVGLSSGEPLGCYESEAGAFQVQNQFLMSLRPDEQKLIINKMYSDNSREAKAMTSAFTAIPKMKGATYEEKALNYVKQNPYYQEQCKGK